MDEQFDAKELANRADALGDPEDWRRKYLYSFDPASGPDITVRTFVTPSMLPRTPGNIFGPIKLRDDLATVRDEIAFAVLVAHGRRQVEPGKPLPDLRALRKLETELIVRLDMVEGRRS